MRLKLYSWLGLASLILGLILLAIHPLIWLVGTWLDPAYASYGLWVAALTGVLLLWSATSPQWAPSTGRQRHGLYLLALTAAVRLLGQSLGINTLGAVALAVDIYAIGLLLDLDRRVHPISPGWLATLFIFALPIERILQRGFGFVLQQLSAASACAMLQWGSASVQCEGVHLQWQEHTLLVDLPCSGTRGLLLLLLLFSAVAAFSRPSLGRACLGLLLTLAAATVGNSLRIIALGLGLIHREALGGIDVFAEPWHSTIGLITLSLSALPLLLWARFSHFDSTLPIASPGHATSDLQRFWSIQPLAGLAFLGICAVIVSLPAQPIDIAHSLPAPQLPDRIATFIAQPGALTSQESEYFTRYGGGAARAAYGPYGLLVVSTSAPLRHLHAPDECLTGSGHTVRYLGQNHGPIPSAVYRSTDPQGRMWRVVVSYVSERGEQATHVAQAVWLWLQAPGTTWRMIERITPWELPVDLAETFDIAVWRALDLSLPVTRANSATQLVKL